MRFFSTRLLYWLIGSCGLVAGEAAVRAESPAEIYQRRVIPLLQSSKASSCSECHLQGINLEDFLSSDPKAAFASLRARGWIDMERPADSKFLQFIAKKPESSNELMDQLRTAELAAISEWIRASVRDPDSLNTPLPNLEDLKLDDRLLRHARKDQVMQRFVEVVWSQFERCANCHSPNRNAKQVEKNGDQMSWIVPNAPEKTLELLEQRKLINIDNPQASLLRTKALGLDEHGGGIKFPADGHTDRQWDLFLTDYATLKRNGYVAADKIPKFNSIRTWRTGLHLRIGDLPGLPAGQYAVVLMHRISAQGKVHAEPTAFGEGRVSKDGSSWSTTMMLVEPTHVRQSRAPADWSALLPDGRYQLRWMVLSQSELPLEKLLAQPSTMHMEIEALWQSGHSGAKVISYHAFTSADGS